MKVVATARTTQGTSASRRLRRAGKVPGIIYGGKGNPVNIEVEHNPLFHSLRKEKFHASILDMELDGKSERVLLRSFQMHPYKPIVLHIDFQRVAEDQKLHTSVPLHFIGAENSKAVKLDHGIVSHVLSELEIECLPKDLPEYIEVDLSQLTVHDTVKVRDLKLPPGVAAVLRGNEDPVVVTVTVPGVQQEEEEAAEAEAAAAAAAPAAETPAGGAKAPAAAAPAAGEKDKDKEKKK